MTGPSRAGSARCELTYVRGPASPTPTRTPTHSATGPLVAHDPGVLEDLGVDEVYLGADLPGPQPVGVQRQDDLIDPAQRRCRFLTMTGVKVPSRSRGTSICTCPLASVNTVLGRVPLRTFEVSGSAVARFFW